MLVAALPAQDAPDLPRRNGRRRGGRLELPQSVPSGGQVPSQDSEADGDPNSDGVPALWVNATTSSELIFLDFERKQSKSDRVRKDALADLLALGLGTRATAIYALDSTWPPTVMLGADLLLSVGIDEDADALVIAASRVSEMQAITRCLDAAMRLQGGWLPKLALNMLEHPLKSVRAAIEARVTRSPHSDHHNGLVRHLRFGRDDDVRLRAVRLLGLLSDQETIRPILRALLPEAKPTFAFALVDALAGLALDSEVESLRADLLRLEPSQEFAYLLLALLQQQQMRAEPLITDELAKVLLPGLEHGDLFIAGTCAVALANWSYLSSEETPDTSLDATLVHRLVAAVDGDKFYPQYARFSPLAEVTLRRVTGEHFPAQNRSAWLTWWLEHGQGFRMVRGNLSLEGDVVNELVFRWFYEGKSYALFAPNMLLVNSEGGRWLPESSFASLRDLIEGSGILSEDIRPGTYGPAEFAVSAQIEIEVGVRRKVVKYRGAFPDPLKPLLVGATALWEEQFWQVLAGPNDAGFVSAHLSSMPDSDWEQSNWLMERARGRLSLLNTSQMALFLQSFVERDPSALSVDYGFYQELLNELLARSENHTLARQLFNLLVSTAHAKGQDLCKSLVDLEEPIRSDLLQLTFERLGFEAAVDGLNDFHPVVRVIATQALGSHGAQAQDALFRALTDQSQTVVQAAIRSFGHRKETAAAGALVPLACAGTPDITRCEALWALGNMDYTNALSVFLEGLAATSPGVQAASIAALGSLTSAEAEQTFAALFSNCQGTPLETPYLQALYKRGADYTRKVLRVSLNDSEPQVVHRALFTLAQLGDPSVAPMLIDRLAFSPHSTDILDALAFATGVDFRDLPDPAGVYQVWWPENFLNDSSTWLARGAADAGFELPKPLIDATQVSPSTAVQALLQLIEKGPAHLRGLASYQLHRITGIDGSVILPKMPAALVSRKAQVWHDWLEAQRPAQG